MSESYTEEIVRPALSLIEEARPSLSCISYNGYPPAFSAFESSAGPLFAALEKYEDDLSSPASQLVQCLEEKREALPR